jgi:hypothetical protein
MNDDWYTVNRARWIRKRKRIYGQHIDKDRNENGERVVGNET